jgi:GxxExxY protein
MPRMKTTESSNERSLLHGAITDQVLGVFYQVHNELGYGFLESIYAGAMACALTDAGLSIRREMPIEVFFRGRRLGKFKADIVVEGAVLLELKASALTDPDADAQVLNYLRASRIQVGLLLHFGPKPLFKRLIYTNERKLLP